MQNRVIKRKITVSVLLAVVFLVFSGLTLFSVFSSAEPEAEIADFGYQTVAGDTFSSESTALRFVFTVGSLNYSRVGFVISKTNKNPTVGGQNCRVHDTTVVYSSITADGKTVSASNGRYWAAVKMTDIPHEDFNQSIYVNAFVEDGSGVRYATPHRLTVREGFESEYEFTPVLRVVLASDIHTRIEGEAVEGDYKATQDEDQLSASRTAQLFRHLQSVQHHSAHRIVVDMQIIEGMCENHIGCLLLKQVDEFFLEIRKSKSEYAHRLPSINGLVNAFRQFLTG